MLRKSTKVFHSFRHTFKRMTRGLYEKLHDAITGHSNKDGVYGRGFSIKSLAKAIL